MDEKMYTTVDLAVKYGVCLRTVLRWIKSGRLKAIKLNGRIYRIPESAMRDFERGDFN